MRLFVDGYNLIFSQVLHDFNTQDSDAAREQLLSLLSAYRHITQDAVTVVFDGHPKGRMYPQMQNVHGITVIFSEADSDADAVIKRLVAKETNPKVVAVVSSDNSIRNFVKRFGSECIDSADFMQRVDRTLAKARATRQDDEPIAKYEGLSKSEVDYWMDVFGLNRKKDER